MEGDDVYGNNQANQWARKESWEWRHRRYSDHRLASFSLSSPLRSLVLCQILEASDSDLSDTEYFFTQSEIKRYKFEPKYGESEMHIKDDSDSSMTDSDSAEDSGRHQTDQNSQDDQ